MRPDPEAKRRFCGEGCAVQDWVYCYESIHPRAFGECANCRTIYVLVLPRQRCQGFRDRVTWGEALRLWLAGNQEAQLQAVHESVERYLKGSGVSQRLSWLLSEHPIAIHDGALAEIQHDCAHQIRMIRDRMDKTHMKLVEEAWKMEDMRRAMSKRGVRTALLKVVEAKNRLRAELRRLGQEVAELREKRRQVGADIQAEREQARRVPLPLPDGYRPPALLPGQVLCQEIVPTEVIYGLVDPRDPELVRYVGRTCDPVHRYRNHMTAGSEAVNAWAAMVMAEGVMPVMVLLESCDRDLVFSREAHWIRFYRQRFQADLNASIPREAVRDLDETVA